MHTFDVTRFRTVSLIAAGISLSLIVSQSLHAPGVAIVLLVCISTACPLYAVRLYRRNDSMMGGLPQANYSYSAGLTILSSGNLLMCWGFLSASKPAIYLGSAVLMAGIAILLAASSLLFQHIIRRGIKSKG